MSELYSICTGCKHQGGRWVGDEVATWCEIDKTDDCDETYSCNYFEKKGKGELHHDIKHCPPHF